MTHRKVDATGRSTGRIQGKKGRLRHPPKGEPWVWLTRELLASPAWRAMSIHGRRLVDFVLVEHMNQGGLENGRLMATYAQLMKWGIPRKYIFRAIKEVEELGLIKCEHGGRWNFTNRPSLFTLTFYVNWQDHPATNCWKRIDDQRVRELRRKWQKTKTRAKNGYYGSTPRRVLRVVEGGKPGQ